MDNLQVAHKLHRMDSFVDFGLLEPVGLDARRLLFDMGPSDECERSNVCDAIRG